jgi:transposase
MSHVIDANHKQLLLLPPDLDEWVSPDDPARFIKVFVESLDLNQLHLTQVTAGAGRPAYANALLLKVWLYGRMHKMRSSRDLERGCHRDLGLIWLTGMKRPDHNTLWRFGKANEPALQELLKCVVTVATQGGLVGFVLHALDGTKIKADVAPGRACSQTIITKVLANLDRIVAELGAPEETSPGEEEYRLPEQLTDPAHLSRLVRTLLQAEKKGERVTLEPGLTKAALTETLTELAAHEEGLVDPVDPEARIMKCDDKKQLGYNAEVVVDAQHGLIVAAKVTQENNDQRQLGPMIQAVTETTGQCAETTVADGGYVSGSQLARAEELGATVLVHDQAVTRGQTGPYHQSAFRYDAAEDCYVCPRGQKLPLIRSRLNRDGVSRDREYVCQQRDCPVRDECSSRRNRKRTIRRSAFAEELERNRARIQQPENRALLKRRKTLVEPVFGQIKHNQGYRRWRVRGLANVCAEWSLIAVVYNLKKMYTLWRAGLFQLCPPQGQEAVT